MATIANFRRQLTDKHKLSPKQNDELNLQPELGLLSLLPSSKFDKNPKINSPDFNPHQYAISLKTTRLPSPPRSVKSSSSSGRKSSPAKTSPSKSRSGSDRGSSCPTASTILKKSLKKIEIDLPFKLTEQNLKETTEKINYQAPEANLDIQIAKKHIILSENYKDSYIFAETYLGDRFVIYLTKEETLDDNNTFDISCLQTTIAKSATIEELEDADTLLELYDRTNLVIREIEKEVDFFKCAIGCATFENSFDGPVRGCVISNNHKIVNLSTEAEDFSNVFLSVYTVIDYKYMQDIDYVIDAVHIINNKISKINFDETRIAIQESFEYFRDKTQKNIHNLLKRANSSFEYRQDCENVIGKIMVNSKKNEDLEMFKEMTLRMKEHRRMMSKVSDMISKFSIEISDKIKEIEHLCRKYNAEIFVQCRRTLSPDTASEFLSAVNWGYPSCIDFADLNTVSTDGNITDDRGEIIPEIKKLKELYTAVIT